MAHFRSRSSSAGGSFIQARVYVISPRYSFKQTPHIQNHHNDHLSLTTPEDMRGSTPERKSSKFSGGGGSFWSRKSLKRSNTANSTSPVVQPPPQIPYNDAQYSPQFGVDEEGLQVPLGSISKLSHSRSLNPESINGTPMASDPFPDLPQPVGFKVKYHLHNPLGPRWYKNHHLIPPAEKQPSARPPTFFSTSFPPISTSSTPDNIHETGTVSKRASVSPQATPASSQTRIGDGIKPRSRKTSQTAPDNVDFMDVTDPWGSTWHHDSPYDILAPVSTKLELDGARPRRASMTAAQNSFKAVAPSPLSQSTSAVHLHDLVPEKPPSTVNSINIAGPRKLSKRRNPNNTDLTTLFNPPTKESDHRKTASAPPTPIERIYLSESITPDSLPKRMSVAPPIFPSQPQPTPKREKRTSFVGRIAKKFSLFRRSEDFLANNSREYSWLHVNAEDHASMKRQSFDHASSHPPSERVGPPKRVAPPSIAQEPQPSPPPEKDEPPTLPPPSPPFSYVSFEAPFSIGKLTVANPDFDPDTGSPIQKPPQLQRDFSVTNSLSPPPSIPRAPSPPPGMLTVQNPTLERTSGHYDKPLPILAPSTAGSTLGLSTPTNVAEKCLGQEDADPAFISRRATVLSAISQKTATPAAPQIPQATPASAVESDSDSDTDSSDSDSSSDMDEEKETSDVSNRAVPPDSTVNAGASTISAAPTLPAKDKPPTIPTSTPTPPPASTLTPAPVPVNPTRSKSPETPSPSKVKSQVFVINDRLSNAPQEVTAFGLPVASVISGITAGVFPPLFPEEMTSQDRINSYLSYTDSPYSTTSVLANPPTPFHSALPIDMDPPAPPLPAKEAKEKESKKQSPSNTPVPQTASQTETLQVVRNHSSDKEAIGGAGQHGEVVNGDARVTSKTRSPKDEQKHRENRSRKDGSQPTTSSSSSRRHTQDEQHHRASVRHSKVPHQADVSSIPMPKMPSTSNVRHSSVYNRYLDDSPPVRQYEENPPPPPPRDDSSSRRRSEMRKEREREKEEEKARAEERRRREERRRQEEEKRYEEEQRERERQREKERGRRRREREREEQREREKEREREMRRQQREMERDLERERERLERERQEWERMERDRDRERQQRELELQVQIQRKLDMEERERERQRLKEMEKERERERERVRELERDREREREKVRELEREKERLKQLEKEREKERQRLLELERERERLRESERERARELEKERERLRQMEFEREKDRLRQIELEKEREKEREKDRRRREREERRKAEKSKRASQHHPDEQRSSDDSRSRRKRESRRSEDERRDKSKSVYHTPDQSRTESYYVNATQSIYLATDSEGRVERKPSTATTRPTSELPSAADMNALRAKEAWDMERMWRARSMYGAELNGNAVQSIPTQSVLSFSDNLSSQGASYGSSYTAFALQTPFQGPPGSSIYHSMPIKPPPIIYGSPASIPSLPDSTLYDPYDQNNIGNTAPPPPPPPSRQHRSGHHGPSPPDNLPVLSRSPLAKNPLPEPPRESTYQPAPLPPLKPATTTVRTNEYWAKYAGVTTNA